MFKAGDGFDTALLSDRHHFRNRHSGASKRRIIMKNRMIMMSLIAAGLFSIPVIFLPTIGRAGPPLVPPPLPLPAIKLLAPPQVVVIPGTYVYFPPDVDADLLFYHGYWYRPYEGRWYRGPHYNGPWGFVSPNRVPRALINLPREYRRIPPSHQRISHGQLKKNWETWEREKHWDKREKKGKGRDNERGEQGPSGQKKHGQGRGRGHDR